MIYHVYSQYTPADPETTRRQALAKQTWPAQPWVDLPVLDSALPRMWREEGRSFPYLRDLIDIGAQGRDDTDILVHTNSDIHVRSDCCVAIAFKLQDADACYCYRRDFARITEPLSDAQFVTGQAYPGHDLTAFRVRWWRAHAQEMPDMVIAFEAWDPCIRLLIEQTHPGGDVEIRDVIAHERHPSFWEDAKNRYRLRGQLYNIGLAKKFLSARGVDPRTRGLR